MVLSSAECAHMYERRMYFRTLAWVYTDLKHTHMHAGEVRAQECRDGPDLPLQQSLFGSGSILI